MTNRNALIEEGIINLEKSMESYSAIETEPAVLNKLRLDLANAYIASKKFDKAQA